MHVKYYNENMELCIEEFDIAVLDKQEKKLTFWRDGLLQIAFYFKDNVECENIRQIVLKANTEGYVSISQRWYLVKSCQLYCKNNDEAKDKKSGFRDKIFDLFVTITGVVFIILLILIFAAGISFCVLWITDFNGIRSSFF